MQKSKVWAIRKWNFSNLEYFQFTNEESFKITKLKSDICKVFEPNDASKLKYIPNWKNILLYHSVLCRRKNKRNVCHFVWKFKKKL